MLAAWLSKDLSRVGLVEAGPYVAPVSEETVRVLSADPSVFPVVDHAFLDDPDGAVPRRLIRAVGCALLLPVLPRASINMAVMAVTAVAEKRAAEPVAWR